MKELVINISNGIENIFLLEDGELIEKYEDSEYKRRLEGNIYIGKVQNVLKGLQAAFVNVGENKNAFIHLKDILPKEELYLMLFPHLSKHLRIPLLVTF